MKITVCCVGKIKESYLKAAIDEYSKRLSRYCKLEILEVADEKTSEKSTEAEDALIRDKEGERLLKKIDESAYVIVLAIDGESLSSEGLADRLDKLTVGGESHLVFVIGGSIGLSEEVLKRADMKLSFSKMTFPHQLMRVILLEQIYRSFRIINGEPYHK